MQFQHNPNPYAPPTSFEEPRPFDGDETQILAERGTRWIARFIDGLLGLAVGVPILIALFAADVMTWRDMQRNNAIASVAYLGATLPIAVYQWSLISRTGQSLGKKWMRIRIVRVDGSPVNFANGVILREWVTAALGLIPVVGGLINLVGILMIFGEQRRCLHDHLAGTKVVQLLK